MSDSKPRPTREAERLSLGPTLLRPLDAPEEQLDDDLMTAYQQGDATALTTLYTRHARGLYLFVSARCPSPLVDDVFQETWARVIGRADLFQGGNFRAWLFRIASNCFVSETRRVNKVKVGDNEAILDILASAADGALDNAIREEERQALSGCVEALSPRAMHVVRARCDGVPYAEIANHLGDGSTTNALMQLYFAAVRQLRACVARKTGDVGGQP